MDNLVMYQRIFDISLEAYGNVKFNKLYNNGTVNIEMHNEEVKYRENNVVEAFINLEEEKKKNLIIKGAIN